MAGWSRFACAVLAGAQGRFCQLGRKDQSMRTWTVWGGLLLVVGLPGCGKIAEKLAEKAAQEAQKQAATPENQEVDKDGQLADKLSHYISCLNGASRNVFDSRNTYTEWMKDEKVGPTGKESHPYGPSLIHQ